MPKWQALPNPSRSISLTPSALKAFESYSERFISMNIPRVPEEWFRDKGETEATTFGSQSGVATGSPAGGEARTTALKSNREAHIKNSIGF